jgi:hypothetical protein
MTTKDHEEKIFDLRTLDYSLEKGLISPKDYQKYLKSLPDDEKLAEAIVFEEEEIEETTLEAENASKEETKIND